jgi:hypothetical protein
MRAENSEGLVLVLVPVRPKPRQRAGCAVPRVGAFLQHAVVPPVSWCGVDSSKAEVLGILRHCSQCGMENNLRL